MKNNQLPYSEVVNKVLHKANQIALKQQSGAVSTEHVLLAFLEVPSLPGAVMKSHGLSREKILDALEKLLGPETVQTAENTTGRRTSLP